MRKVAPELVEKLSTLIDAMSYELLGCEWVSQGQWVLRVYIDSAKGVTVDDCSRVSHQVSAMLDVEDPGQARYVLQVSSPGIDRPLFKLEHYCKYVGSRVDIKLYLPFHQRKHYKGILRKVEGESISLWVEDMREEVVLPFSAIEKAHLIGDIHF